MRDWIAISLFCAFCIPIARAQQPSTPLHPPTATEDAGYDGGVYGYANVFAGPAFAIRNSTSKFAGIAGVSLGEFQAKPLKKGFAVTPAIEIGVIGSIPGGRTVDGLVSFNGAFTTIVPHHEAFPFFSGGYTRIFTTGDALNFGIGIDLGDKKSDRLIRLDLRDYYLFDGPQQNVVSLRVAFGSIFSDN